VSVAGLDVSDFQGAVDWPAVAAAGVGFAFAKATEGVDFVAETFARNWAGIRAAGLVRGAYHFFLPLVDAQAQAEQFLATAAPGPGDLPPALDVEVRDGVDALTFVRLMGQWLDAVETATRRQPLIYASPSFLGALGDLRGFSRHPLWIADYGTSAPTAPRGWRTYTFWQYTVSGNVNGIAGAVDLDLFNGSPKDLAAFVATGRVPAGGRPRGTFLREGDAGPGVAEIQTRLKAKGFDPGPADGVFGPQTRTAVIAFQRAANLVVDGIVGPQTLAALRA
jgi:lysozyme